MWTRATSNFRRKEWFGNVCVKMEHEGEEEKASYGHLCVVLKCNMKVERAENIRIEFCYVRKYEDIGLHTYFKCIEMKRVEDSVIIAKFESRNAQVGCRIFWL